MLRRAHMLCNDEEERVSKILTLAWKKYENICIKIFGSGAGGSKLEQKSAYVIFELSLSYYTIIIQSLDTLDTLDIFRVSLLQ